MTLTKEKKEYIVLGVLLVATGGVIYFNFLRKPARPQVPVNLTVNPNGAAGQTTGNPATIPTPEGGAASPVVIPSASAPVGGGAAAAGSGFLPNGPKVDVEGLSKDKRFTELQPPNYPTVTRDELGVAQPFADEKTSKPTTTPSQ